MFSLLVITGFMCQSGHCSYTVSYLWCVVPWLPLRISLKGVSGVAKAKL